MIIQLEKAAPVAAITEHLRQQGYKSTEVTTQHAHYLVAIGKQDFDIRTIGQLPGVRDVHQVSDDYQLVSRKWRVKPTVLDLGDGVTSARAAWRCAPARAASKARPRWKR